MHSAIRRLVRRAAAAIFVASMSPCLAVPAAAQQPTQAQQNAIRQSCRADYQANCSGVPTGGAPALACLQQHADQLSGPCQAAVGAIGGSGGNAPQNSAPAGNAGAQSPPSAGSVAPAMTPRQQAAVLRGYCGADYRTYCPGVRPGGGRAMQCLEDHGASLSAACRRALSRFAQ